LSRLFSKKAQRANFNLIGYTGWVCLDWFVGCFVIDYPHERSRKASEVIPPGRSPIAKKYVLTESEFTSFQSSFVFLYFSYFLTSISFFKYKSL